MKYILVIIAFLYGVNMGFYLKDTISNENEIWVNEHEYCSGKTQGWMEGRHPEIDVARTECKFELGYEFPENWEMIHPEDFVVKNTGIYDCICEDIKKGTVLVECPNFIPKDWNEYCETAKRNGI